MLGVSDLFIYVCSPYSGDAETNAQKAKRYSRFVVEQQHQPITPHLLYPRFLDENSRDERELGLKFGLALLPTCREMWVFGDFLSSGMAGEIEEAKRLSIPILYFNSDCERK